MKMLKFLKNNWMWLLMLGLATWGLVLNIGEGDYSSIGWIVAYMLAVGAWWRTSFWLDEAHERTRAGYRRYDEMVESTNKLLEAYERRIKFLKALVDEDIETWAEVSKREIIDGSNEAS